MFYLAHLQEIKEIAWKLNESNLFIYLFFIFYLDPCTWNGMSIYLIITDAQTLTFSLFIFFSWNSYTFFSVQFELLYCDFTLFSGFLAFSVLFWFFPPNFSLRSGSWLLLLFSRNFWRWCLFEDLIIIIVLFDNVFHHSECKF